MLSGRVSLFQNSVMFCIIVMLLDSKRHLKVFSDVVLSSLDCEYNSPLTCRALYMRSQLISKLTVVFSLLGCYTALIGGWSLSCWDSLAYLCSCECNVLRKKIISGSVHMSID
jgi:hypothetical protein